jgi:hypothetical protein
MIRRAAVALGFVLFAASPGAFAGPPVTGADQAGNQPLLDSRLDQLARPETAPGDSPPTLDTPRGHGSPAPGSFPRSFLIPGTDTSVSISGFFDATGTTRAGR